MREVNMKPTKSIDKAIKLLNCFSYGKQFLTINEISKMANIPKSTTYRLLCTLESYKFIYYNPEDLTYCLGIKMLEYGAIVLERSKIIPIARPFIVDLNQKTGFSVNLTVKEEDRLLFIDKSESFISLQYSTTVGRSRDLHYSSAGKIFMADLDEQTVQEILAHSPLKKYTNFSIAENEEFLNELKKVKEQGYAIDDNESNLNALAVSAAIRNAQDGIVAVITAVGPRQLIMDYPLSKLVTQVTDCASQVSLKFI